MDENKGKPSFLRGLRVGERRTSLTVDVDGTRVRLSAPGAPDEFSTDGILAFFANHPDGIRITIRE